MNYIKKGTCIDCGTKVLSKTKPKKKCPACEDKSRAIRANAYRVEKRKKLKEAKKGL